MKKIVPVVVGVAVSAGLLFVLAYAASKAWKAGQS